MAYMASCLRKKHVPGSETTGEEIFDFPFLKDKKTMEFIESHGNIMFIIRGPPGTAKGTLSSLFCDTYPNSVTCSADAYFSRPFVSKNRDRNSLTDSHKFCQKRVEEECEKRTNPIIVQNTHIKKWEVNVYLDFAKKYGYTVIMAITLRKFKVDAEILERTNTKHLSKNYLIQRLKNWEEYMPMYLGWFLCPEDQLFILNQAKNVLQCLLDDKRLCAYMDVKCEEDIWGRFVVEKQLYCVSAHCENGRQSWQKSFYLSEKVQNCYGKHFLLEIPGFVISKTAVYAVVAVSKRMKPLIMTKPQNPVAEACTEDDLSDLFESMSLATREKGTKTFKENFCDSGSGKTAVFSNRAGNELNAVSFSYILIAQSKHKPMVEFGSKWFTELFSLLTNEANIIDESKLFESKDGTKYAKVMGQSLLLLLKKQITVSSILTGIYNQITP